jgi:putative membrane protein
LRIYKHQEELIVKKIMVYGAAVLALAAAPVFAQSGSTAGQSGTTTGAAGSGQSRQGGTDASMRGSSPDHMFVMEAAQGGMAEVALGRLAGEKASSDRVKQFGQRMVSDHSKANDELKALAQTKSISIPADLDAKHKATQDRLSKLSGAAFDRAYIQEMVADHKKDVADFRKESQSGSDSEVKAWAGKTLPTLEEHYKMVQDISSSLRGGAVGTSGTGSAGTGSTGTGSTGTGSTGTGSTGTGAGSGSGSGNGSPMPGSSSGTPGSTGSANPNGTNNPR